MLFIRKGIYIYTIKYNIQLEVEQNNISSCGTLPPSLTEISFASNNISVLPLELTRLPKLSSLNLSNNNFIELTKEFSLFPKLSSLYLDNNKIVIINEEVQFPELKICSLVNNQLSIIPKKLFESPFLNSLVLTNNQITKQSLVKMEGFDFFDKRRIEKVNKGIQGNVIEMRELCGIN